MRLCLINPCNLHVTGPVSRKSRWRRFFATKPLSLLLLGRVTPPEWEIEIVDENRCDPDYVSLPRPDLVGITVMTAQAPRAYELAGHFRRWGVPVVLGGMHVSTRPDEAQQYADAIVIGEGDCIWPQVLADARARALNPVYVADPVDPANISSAKHVLLPEGYGAAPIQTSRGCQLQCTFCSISALSGHRRRHRPIGDVVRELKEVPERKLLFVDENLIGITEDDMARAKDLFRAMVKARIDKPWVAWVTINVADDDELLALAARSGCSTVIVGFETDTRQGLTEIDKQFNVLHNRDFSACVRRIQRHGIWVLGSFFLGLDGDEPGVGRRIADAASRHGVDFIGATLLTPFPGTRLWEKLESEDRIIANRFPDDWQRYTLALPVARYANLSTEGIVQERRRCLATFYSPGRILSRTVRSLLRGRRPIPFLLLSLLYARRWRMRET